MFHLNLFSGIILTGLLALFLHILLFSFNRNENTNFNLKEYVLNVSIMGFIYYYGELCLGLIFHYIFEYPLWQYNQLLIPHSFDFSSLWSAFGWAFYAGIMYHIKITVNWSYLKFILIAPIIAMTIEYIINSLSLLLFNEFIFYYEPGDLQHKTTLLAYIPYLMALHCIYFIDKFLDKTKNESFFTILTTTSFFISLSIGITIAIIN